MIAIPHGLPAKILAALQWAQPIDALQIAHHGRLGYSDETIEAIARAAEEMVEAGYGIVVGWDAASLRELAAKHGWSPDDVSRLKRLRARYCRASKEARHG